MMKRHFTPAIHFGAWLVLLGSGLVQAVCDCAKPEVVLSVEHDLSVATPPPPALPLDPQDAVKIQVTGPGVSATVRSPFDSLQMLPHEEYTLSLVIDSQVLVQCDTTALLKFPHCDIEYLEKDSTVWKKGSQVTIQLDDVDDDHEVYATKPEWVKIRLTPPQSDDKTKCPAPGTEVELKTTSPAIRADEITGDPEVRPGGAGVDIPGGAAMTADGTYRSAGSLVKYGTMGGTFATPSGFEFHSPSEVASGIGAPVEVSDGMGGIAERHFVTPDAVLRLRGWNGSSTTTSFTGASESIVQVYDHSQYNGTSKTFTGSPHSWYRLEVATGNDLEDGITLIQSNRGVERSESIQASDDWLTTRAQKGPLVTEKQVIWAGTGVSEWSLETTVSRDGEVTSSVAENWLLADWGNALMDSTVDPDPDPLVSGDEMTTFYRYYPDGRRRLVYRPDGSWEFYEFHGFASDLTKTTYSSWLSETDLDYSLGDWALPEEGPVVVRDVTYGDEGDTEVSYVKDLSDSGFGTMIGKSATSENEASGTTTRTVWRTASEYYSSYSKVYTDDADPAWLSGRTIMTWDGSGRAVFYEYERGNWNGSAFSPDAEGDYLREGATTGVIASPSSSSDEGDFSPVTEHSLRTRVVTGSNGVVLEEEQVYTISSAFETAVARVYEYEPTGLHRLTGIKIGGAFVAKTDYPSGLVTKSYDDSGSWVEREVDEYGELVHSTTSGGGAVPAVETTYAVNGRTRTTSVASHVVSTEVRDAAGRVISRQDATGALTSYGYSNGGRTVTVTKPGGVTEVSSRELDGRALSVTGTGVVPSYFSYEVVTGGLIKQTTRIGGSENARASSVTRNWDGSTAFTSKPGPPDADATVDQTYSYASGARQLLRVESSADGVPDQVWSDNSGSAEGKIGMFTLSGTEIDGDGLEVESEDRVTEIASKFVKDGGVWYRQTVRSDYYKEGEDDAYTATTKEALAPVSTTHGTHGSGLRWKTSVSRGDRTIDTCRDCFFAAAVEQRVTEDLLTSGSRDSVVTTLHGSEISSAKYGSDGTEAIETRTYNSSGQLVSVKVPTGAKTIYEYNPTGQLVSTRDFQNHITRYSYYPPSEAAAGRLWKVTNPLMEVTETKYDLKGRVEETTGNGAYRVKWIYNEWGEVSGMRTYRSGDTGDLTEWDWDDASGVLNSKTDAAGKATEFKYDSAGRLHSRSAPRSLGEDAVTTYSYTDFGDPEGVVYDDFEDTSSVTISTPSVTYSGHDRLGRPTHVADGSGARDIVYNSEGIDDVSYDPGSLLSGLEIDYKWYSSLRYYGYDVNGSGAPYVRYSYDSADRIYIVSSSGAFGTDHTYGWLPGTRILQTLDGGNGAILRTTSHDQAGRLRGIETRDGTNNLISRHGYLLDKVGRRTRAVRENGQAWDYRYNPRGEVTSGVKSFAAGGVIPGHEFAYQYDGIGNRLSATEGGSAIEVNYGTPNALNQYAEVNTSDGRYILGEAPLGGGDVMVNAAVEAQWAGGLGFFGAELQATNTAGPVWSHDTVVYDAFDAIDGYTFTPKASVSPTYDWSGNLTWDGRWDYTWDGENRLIKMETAAIAYGAGVPRLKLEFVYDSQGRRVSKTVSTWGGSSYAFTSNTRFLWDDWNLIGEYSAPSASSTSLTLQAVHTWGVDLSGTLQGAGGVGGLLSTELKSPAAICYPAYDGNGNISAWADSGGEVLERRDYSPFGREITLHRFGSEAVLEKLRFGFSTKYCDGESGLLYYGYRYYDPLIGRWTSRDPLEERGGLNLFGFLANNTIGEFDALGLSAVNHMAGPIDVKCRLTLFLAAAAVVEATEGSVKRGEMEISTILKNPIPYKDGTFSQQGVDSLFMARKRKITTKKKEGFFEDYNAVAGVEYWSIVYCCEGGCSYSAPVKGLPLTVEDYNNGYNGGVVSAIVQAAIDEKTNEGCKVVFAIHSHNLKAVHGEPGNPEKETELVRPDDYKLSPEDKEAAKKRGIPNCSATRNGIDCTE